MKITKIKKGKQDQYGNCSFWLTIEGEQSSYLLKQKSDFCQFQEGDEIPSDWEKKTEQYKNKEGEMVTYFRLFAPKKDFVKQGSGYKTEPFEHKAAGFAAAYTKDMVVSGIIQISEIKAYFDAFYNLIISKKVNQ